jgi:hypothetical protein
MKDETEQTFVAKAAVVVEVEQASMSLARGMEHHNHVMTSSQRARPSDIEETKK